MKLGILLVAYGSSNSQGEYALRTFDGIVRTRFPNIAVRWAFSSLLIRERLAKKRVKRDSVNKALEKMYFEKYTHIAVQPLQTIPGSEHLNIIHEKNQVMRTHKNFIIHVGTPLLQTKEDIDATAHAIIKHLPHERLENESVVFMGHGAKHTAVSRYLDLAHAVYSLDTNVHIGTMNGDKGLEDIIPQLIPGKKVWLMPLLSTIGQHALQDMAGKQKYSWRSKIEAKGFKCEPVLHGLAEYEGFMNIWLLHLQHIMNNILQENKD